MKQLLVRFLKWLFGWGTDAGDKPFILMKMPDDLYDEIQVVAIRKRMTEAEVLRCFFKVGVLAAALDENADGKNGRLIVRDDDGEVELKVFGRR